MSTHEINIKTPVCAMDGANLGDVTRVFVDVERNRLTYLAVDKGIFEERLVDADLVADSSADRVTLSITEAEAKRLPRYVHREVVQTRGTIELPTHSGATVRLAGTNGRWHEVDTAGAEFPDAIGSSLFMQAPIGQIITQEITSISEGEVAISERTDVVGSDGRKLGRVDEVLFDDENRIVGFVVKTGLLVKHDVRIPMAWVAGIAHDHVRLSVTKEEAASGGKIATA